MEFDYTDIFDGSEELNKEMDRKLNFIYRYKKMSKNQKDFTKNLIKNILNNRASLFEFSPTLDKLFLICSSLITILNFEKSKINLLEKTNNKNKFILIVKSEDIIFEALTNFKELFNLEINSFNKKFLHQIVPLLDRKIFCINEKAMENSSSIDFDTFCNAQTSSWVNNINQCSSHKVIKINNLFKI